MKFIYKVGIEKFLLTIGVFLSCIGIGILTFTYSKYVTGASGNASVRVARWNITINDQNVADNANFSSVIEPVFPGNSNIASDVIAPTAEGYFDITIDGTNTDVSFTYTITTSNNVNSAVSDLVLSGYSIDGGARQAISDANGQLSISNSILYDQQDKDVDIRVYFMWNDDSENGATMNNSDDTSATLNSENRAMITVNVNVVQLANTPSQNNDPEPSNEP